MNKTIIHNGNGDLTILREWLGSCPTTGRPNYRAKKSLVRCYCGKEFSTWKAHLLNRHVKSCGCYRSTQAKEAHTRHNHSRRHNYTPTYECWASFKKRCYNPSNKNYKTNGGRGIKVCPEWLTFEGFLKDMGVKPPGHRLNRIDKDGDFEPDNCEWVPLKARR